MAACIAGWTDYVGADHHKRYSHMAVLVAEQHVLKAEKVLNTSDAVRAFVVPYREGDGAAVEASREWTVIIEESGDIGRFAGPKKLCAYAARASDGKLLYERLTRQGQKCLSRSKRSLAPCRALRTSRGITSGSGAAKAPVRPRSPPLGGF